MHRPPAVSYTVERSWWHGCLLLGTWLVALGLLLYFFAFQLYPLTIAALAVIWLLCGWISFRAWRASALGLLRWDGELWQWIQNGDGQTCDVRVVWDLQQLVLVRKTTELSASQWLWLEAGASMHQWDALRRALVSASAGFIEPTPTIDLEGQR